jgi:hypothetical protein
MKNIVFGAIALAIAVPAAAQTAPAEPKTMECCEKMKAEGKACCCKDMAGKDHGELGKQDHQPKADDGAAHDGHGEHAH